MKGWLTDFWGELRGIVGSAHGQVVFGTDRPTTGSIEVGRRQSNMIPLLLFVVLVVLLLSRRAG